MLPFPQVAQKQQQGTFQSWQKECPVKPEQAAPERLRDDLVTAQLMDTMAWLSCPCAGNLPGQQQGKADTCPGTSVVPAPLDTAHSCFWTPYISQKERGAEGTQQVTQTMGSQGMGPCQAWLHPCCWSSFGFPPGVFLLLSQWWWLSPCWGVVWARAGSLVSPGEGCIFPVLWEPGKMCFVKSEALNPNLHQSPKGKGDK